MKVRCSNGLQVSAYHGNFLQHTFGADLEIGTIDADKALGVLFSYDGKLDPKLDAHFQAALLYTAANGQRRVRCINIVAGVNEGGIETMKCIDQDAVVAIIAKEGECPSHQFFEYVLMLNSCLESGRQDIEGYSGQYHGKDSRHLLRIPQEFLWIASSWSAGSAGESQRILNVHAWSAQVESLQG